MTPTASQVHVDQLLSNISIAFRNTSFIAPDLAPNIPVGKQTGLYAVYDKGHWFRRPTTRWVDGTNPNEVTFTVGSGNYNCRKYGIGHNVLHSTINNADDPFRPLEDGVELMRDLLSLDYEARVASTAWAGCGSSQTLTGTAAFTDFDNSDPLTVFRTGRQAIRATTGKRPNVAVVPQKTLDVLTNHPDLIRALFPGAGIGGQVDQAGLQKLLQVDRLLVPDAIINTAQEGNSDSFTDVWSTSIIMAYVEPRPGIMKPTFMSSFIWSVPDNGEPPAFSVKRRTDEKREVEEIWTGYWSDEKIIAPEMGFLIATGV